METNEDYTNLLLLNEIEERDGRGMASPLGKGVGYSTDYRVIHYLQQRIHEAVNDLEYKTMGGIYNQMHAVLSYGVQTGIVQHFQIDIGRDYEFGVAAECGVTLNNSPSYTTMSFLFA